MPVVTIDVLDHVDPHEEIDDEIHESENFEHETTVNAYGDSGSIVYTIGGPANEYFYWFKFLDGESTFTTLDTGATSEVTLEGFEFEATLGNFSYSLGCQIGEPDPEEPVEIPDVMAWATWTGGVVTIENEFGQTVLNDVVFTGGVIISYYNGNFGKATGMFTAGDNIFQLALPEFDGTQGTQTVEGDGLLVFNASPKLSITNPPSKGTAEVVAGEVVYTPNASTDGVDDFEYQVMTQLGDKDTAAVNIGTMDLDIYDLNGAELTETVEDNPGLFLGVNNDDDNDNKISDLNESGFVDNDLVKLRIKELAPNGLDPLEGYFTLSFDPKIRVWHSNDKVKPNHRDDAQVISAGESSTPTRFRINNPTTDPPEDFVLWVEGVSWGVTTIAMTWHGTGGSGVYDSVTVNVVGVDYDIDSDNNNGFDYPDNTDWEEYLEDSKYGLGKLVFPNDTHFTPTRLRLPKNLPTGNQSPYRIVFDFQPVGKSGVIRFWNTHKADPNRIDEEIGDGGNRILMNTEYTLEDLRYDPATGGITAWVETFIAFSTHSTKKGVIEFGKPDDRIAAIVRIDGVSLATDQVKYMCVQPDTFYPHLQQKEFMRNGMASEKVYLQTDGPEFALKKLDSDELAVLGIPQEIIDLIGEPASIPGFKSAIYWDHVSGKYVLSFAGTDDVHDVIVDIWQGLGGFTSQYDAALRIGRGLREVPRISGNSVITGHSLGGGLASAASVASGFHADTFNAAGLLRSVLLKDQFGNPFAGNPLELARYDNAPALIDAYYLDYDILSFVQDKTPLQDAIGSRIEMDGPLDFEVGFAAALLVAKLASGAGWISVFLELGQLGYYMGLCHSTKYYHYGFLVDESTGWDIYGYDDF